MEAIDLVGQERKDFGTRSSGRLRKAGLVPSIIYSKDKGSSVHFSLQSKELIKCYRAPHYISQIFTIKLGSKTYKVLPHDIQMHPVKDEILHADFVVLNDKSQKIKMPINYVNKDNCIGVKRGGYFNTVRRNINILCPVNQLTRAIDFDVSDIVSGQSIKVSSLTLPTGATLLEKENMVIASVIGKKGKGEEEEGKNASTEETATAEEKKAS